MQRLVLPHSLANYTFFATFRFIKDVAKDAAAIVKPLADPDREYHGKVTLISSVAINRNGETVVPIQIELEDMDSFLLPGFNVDVEVQRIQEEPVEVQLDQPQVPVD